MSKTSYKERRLSDKMKHEAVTLGLCAQWTAEWQDGTSKDEMVEKFVEGIDFCIQHNWPSVEVMKRASATSSTGTEYMLTKAPVSAILPLLYSTAIAMPP